MLAASLIIMVVAGALGLGAVMGLVVGGANESAGDVLAGIGAAMLGLLVAVTLGMLVAMAIWFAPGAGGLSQRRADRCTEGELFKPA